ASTAVAWPGFVNGLWALLHLELGEDDFAAARRDERSSSIQARAADERCRDRPEAAPRLGANLDAQPQRTPVTIGEERVRHTHLHNGARLPHGHRVEQCGEKRGDDLS